MAVPVARVHLKMAHGALPALLPSPPKWKMLPVFPIPTPCVAAILPKPLAKPGRADADERWDAHKTKSASPVSSPSSSPGPRSADSSTGHGSPPRNNRTSPPPKPGRADSVERWDAHKKATIPASSSGTSSVVSSKCSISRASSGERWDVHKKRGPTQADQWLNDDESRSTGSNDVDDTEEEIVWKPRAMYAGPGFVSAAPEPSMLPIPTGFLVSAA